MQRASVKWLVAAGVIVGSSSLVSAQELAAGKTEYLSSCAACHGADGKGNGPMTAELKMAPPDLTVLAKKNNGVFPIGAVYEMVDGRTTVGAHGTREMPIWGFRFSPSLLKASPPSDIDANLGRNPEFIVRSRILALVDYLNRIQEK